jgi:hypothetical protein
MIETADRNTAPTLRIKGIAEPVDRIPFGSEPVADPSMIPAGPCHDCGVERGDVHWFGCDMELCPNCGAQLIGCACEAVS